MCGRFTLSASATALVEQFDLANLPNWTPRYNIAPTQEALTVAMLPGFPGRYGRLLRWGLIPRWAKGPRSGSSLTNARAETVAGKAAFRHAFRQRRCLILANGFYEWQRQDHRKQPYYIRLRDDRPFAFAGLWERWVPEDGQPLDSCAILTTAANTLMKPLHLRMPVILSSADAEVWLDPGVHDPDRVQPLLRPYPAEEMVAYPVGPLVNDPAHDSPECIAPLA